MTTTRQSIVTWHPWPENGVEGLPPHKPMLFQTGKSVWGGMILWNRLNLKWYYEGDAGGSIDFWSFGSPGCPAPTHYALASDLERDIDVDQQSVAPHSPKPGSGTSKNKGE